MSLLTATELRRIERHYVAGVSSATIVNLFQEKGERFSEATLRKYVQLGLLPKSRRVGTRGRHRGSTGVYPVAVVRLINEIKASLDKGGTLGELRVGTVGLGGEVQVLRRAADQVLSRFAEAIGQQSEKKQRSDLTRVLDKHRKALDQQARALDRFAEQVVRAAQKSNQRNGNGQSPW